MMTAAPSSSPHAEKRKLGRAALIVLILLVGAGLRLEHVTQPFADKFSWREASTAMMAQNFYRGQWNILYPEVDWGGPGPNYQGREFQTVTYIAALLYKMFGQHDWVGRCVAVAFGLWGIFALYQLTRRVWDHERALVSAALMSVLPGAVFIERSFLPDPAMVALVVTSLWLLVAYCQTKKMQYLALSVVVGALGFLTKLPGIILGIPAAYAIYAILGRRALERKQFLGLLAAAMSILATAAGYYLWARYLSLAYPPHHFAGANQFVSPDKIGHWIERSYFLPELGRQLFGWLWTWPPAVLVLIGLLCSPSKKEKAEPERKAAPWLFHWYGAALVGQYLIEAQHLVEDPNNMHLWNPFAAAMGGHAIISMTQWLRRRDFEYLRIAATVAIIVVVGAVGRQQLESRYRPAYAPSYHIGTTLSKIAKANDLVVSVGLNPCTIYYSGLRGWTFPPTEVWHTALGWDYGDLDIESMKSLWAQGAKWLVISNSNDEYPNADDLKRGRGRKIWSFIRNNFELHVDDEDGMIFRLPAYPLQPTVSKITRG